MFTKSTILFALLSSLLTQAAPAEAGPEKVAVTASPEPGKPNVETPTFILKFANPKDSWLIDGSSYENKPWDKTYPDTKELSAQYTDGTWDDSPAKEDGGGNYSFHIMKNGKAENIFCTIEGQLKLGEVPEFTISSGDHYLSPCGDNKGITFHCGEYGDRSLMSQC